VKNASIAEGQTGEGVSREVAYLARYAKILQLRGAGLAAHDAQQG
jgi:hypothetical protein